MTDTTHERNLPLIFALALALAAALWSALGSPGCAACRAVELTLGGWSLGWIGVAAYAALLLGAVLRPGAPLILWLLIAGAGVHLGLVLVLWTASIACWSCIVAAGASFLAVAAALRHGVPSLEEAAIIFCVCVLAGFGGTYGWQYYVGIERQARAQAQLETVIDAEGRPEDGDSLLIVYERPNCGYCEEFKAELLPEVRATYGDALAVDLRQAPGNLPTPSLLILGADNEAALAGMSDPDHLWKALDQTLNPSKTPEPNRGA